MKRITSIILACLILVSAIGSFTAAQAQEKSLLPNTYAKMMAGEKIHVGYFGGSVTNGYGAQQGVNCWRGLSIRWLDENYGKPNGGSFYEGIHAGLGGSGTELNLYRADHYLGLDGNDPVDLLFIEFAINDGYIGKSYERSAYHMESIINKVRTKNPTCDIVVVLTTDFGYASGTKDFIYAQAHRDVAEHYGVPVVDFGTQMWEHIIAENGGTPITSQGNKLWTKYFNDGCHPNAEGYAKYFEFLRDSLLKPSLDKNSAFSTKVTNYTLPEKNYNTTDKFLERQKFWMPDDEPTLYNIPLRSDAYLVFPSAVENVTNGYQFGESYGTEELEISKPGASFTATFNSKSAGVYFKGTSKNGLIQYRVDGGKWQTYNMSTTTENSFFMFYEFLPEGEHTVEAILRQTLTGTDFTLRAFLIDGDSKKAGVTFGDAPNKEPIDEIYYSTVTQTPEEINLDVSNNNGSSREIIHHHTDAKVLQFTPNTASTDEIISNTRTSISNNTYKYAVIDYFYDVPDGTNATAVGTRPALRFLQLNDGKTLDVYSADTIVANKRADALVDISVLKSRGLFSGLVKNMQLLPYGNLTGNQLSASEQMSIRGISYYCEYPYENQVKIDVNKAITASPADISLTGRKILPSAFGYLKLDFAASPAADSDVTVTANGIYNSATGNNDKTISITKKIKAGETSAFISLSDIATAGHMYYLDSISLSASTAVNLASVTFSEEHPFPDKLHEVIFDANGGVGTVPANEYKITITDKNLPTPALTKNGTAFIGWSTVKNSTDLITTVQVPEQGITLYAVYEYDTDLSNCAKDSGCPLAKYTDLKTTSWYHDGLHYCLEKGVFKGTSETLFSPSALCTRGAVVTVLYRIDGEPNVSGSSFADIEPGTYFEKAVIWAQKNNIVTGVSDLEFAPNNTVSREQLAAIIYRYAKYKGYDLSVADTTDISAYADASTVGAYAITGIKYAVGTGLIKGKSATTLNPKDTATRAEIATIVQRFINLNK